MHTQRYSSPARPNGANFVGGAHLGNQSRGRRPPPPWPRPVQRNVGKRPGTLRKHLGQLPLAAQVCPPTLSARTVTLFNSPSRRISQLVHPRWQPGASQTHAVLPSPRFARPSSYPGAWDRLASQRTYKPLGLSVPRGFHAELTAEGRCFRCHRLPSTTVVRC